MSSKGDCALLLTARKIFSKARVEEKSCARSGFAVRIAPAHTLFLFSGDASKDRTATVSGMAGSSNPRGRLCLFLNLFPLEESGLE